MSGGATRDRDARTLHGMPRTCALFRASQLASLNIFNASVFRLDHSLNHRSDCRNAARSLDD